MRTRLTMQGGSFGRPLPDAVMSLMLAVALEREASSPIVELDEVMIDAAFAEDIAPLVGAGVRQGRVAVPPNRRERLLSAHEMCLASNLVRSHRLRTFAALCTQVSIPVVPLKGMAMIQSVMQPGERSMGDVDILVPASRWREACELIMRLGFIETRLPGRSFTAAHDYVRSFSSPAGMVVEIHRFVCERSFLRIDYDGPDGIFARARPIAGGLFLLEEGDLFLTLAAHAAKHTLDLPLRSFVDGLFLWQRTSLDIGRLQDRARSWHMQAAFERWIQALGALAPHAAIRRTAVVLERRRARLAHSLGRLVWEHTSHASRWQRLTRMAWLTDSGADWVRHMAARGGLRLMDLLQSKIAAPGRAPRA